MKALSFLFVLSLLVFLGACTTGGSEPISEPPTESPESAPESAPALDSVTRGGLVPPPEVSPESYPAPAPVIVPPDEPYPGSEAAAESAADTSTAYPAQVDLSQITPQPSEDTGPVVAPQPGVPDAKTAVSHQVSQDLAQRLGVDVSEVSTVTAEEIEWPDSSLGCPASGMVYLTVITPGYKIILEAAGQPYSYHTDTQGNYILCGEDGQPVSN